MSHAIANRYVSALAEVVAENDSGITVEQALQQLDAFASLLDESPQLANVLKSPAVQPADKQALVEEIGERIGLSKLIRNFLHVVVEHRRIVLFDELLEGFRLWLDEYRDRVQIEVRVATGIGEDNKTVLEQRFKQLTGKDVQATYIMDSAVLGGSIVRIGSTVYDGSVRSALSSLATSMGGEL